VKDSLVRSQQKLYVTQLEKRTLETLINLTEEELKPIRKSDIEDIVNSLEVLLADVISADDAAERLEKFCLDFSLKCIRSSLVEKRVNGLQYLEDALEMAKTRDTFGLHPPPTLRVTRWIKLQYVDVFMF